MRALRVFDGAGDARIVNLGEADLEGEVTVRVRYSGINYKDALAVTGKGQILRRYPLTAGIDAAGHVVHPGRSALAVDQPVLITGGGIGESRDGGFADVIKVDAAAAIPLPNHLSLYEAMALGTAGFTAALALYRMEQNGQRPDLGSIVITGASGGVGSLATQIFAQVGYEVIAVSGKPEASTALKRFGAAKVETPESLNLGARPLESVRFGGAVDNVGGALLSGILAHVNLWGNVAAIGLAADQNLNATVMPFILRGVSLLGASSGNTPAPLRAEIWRRLADAWKPKYLNEVVFKTVALEDVPAACQQLIDRNVRGRVLVDMEKTK